MVWHIFAKLFFILFEHHQLNTICLHIGQMRTSIVPREMIGEITTGILISWGIGT